MERNELRRYTNLASAIHILRTKALTLLSPTTWDDRNDRALMAAYQRRLGHGNLLALCFAQAAETYHHWKVFAPGSDGICIVFNKTKLLNHISGLPVLSGSVDYYTLDRLGQKPPDVDRAPFAKRSAFSDEREFRLVYCTSDPLEVTFEVPIDFECIDRVVLNPWLPAPLYRSLSETIFSIDGCANLRISQSSVIDAQTWRQFAERIASESANPQEEPKDDWSIRCEPLN